MNPVATFNGLTLREADQLGDVQRLEDWIAADEAHRGIYTPRDFMSGQLAEDPRSSCYALEDKNGVLFYIRLSRASRVRIQFAPEGTNTQKARVIRGLFHGMTFLENQLAHAGCEEWIFDTDSPRLKRLAEQVLGFTESTHELVKPIANPDQPKED